MLHTWAWIAWLIATVVLFSSSRNPYYLLITIGSIAIVIKSELFYQSINNPHNPRRLPFNYFRFAIILISLSAVFNAFMSHLGENIIFKIPSWIPIINGPITWEAVVYGALNGLVLFGILFAFTQINLALPVRMLIRLIPHAFYPIAVTTSIALTYVPNTVRQFHKIREAQAIRGFQIRKLSDWVPLIIPLMVGGLEQAFSLSEAMVSRGFASEEHTQTTNLSRILILGGLLSLSIGIVFSIIPDHKSIGVTLITIGVLAIIYVIIHKSKQVPHTTYMQEYWHFRDWIVLLGICFPLGMIILPISPIDKSSLVYNPYPALSLPDFNIFIGISLLGFLSPALVNLYYYFRLKKTKS